ncbi:hypothetical protein ACWDYJ_06210 [Streptomyces sp. NPDC003042]
MTSIHRLALLKAAIGVGAIRVAPSALGASTTTPTSTGTIIPMRPASPDGRGGFGGSGRRRSEQTPPAWRGVDVT